MRRRDMVLERRNPILELQRDRGVKGTCLLVFVKCRESLFDQFSKLSRSATMTLLGFSEIVGVWTHRTGRIHKSPKPDLVPNSSHRRILQMSVTEYGGGSCTGAD